MEGGGWLLRWAGLVLGANLLVPVSCVLGTAGAATLGGVDVRDVASGEPPHEPYRIAVARDDGTLALKPLARIGNPDRFTLPSRRGDIPAGRCCRASYRVTGVRGDTQVIELTYAARDGDFRAVSVYRAGPDGVEPLQSRAERPGATAVATLPWGIAVAACVWLVGRGLRRLERTNGTPGSA